MKDKKCILLGLCSISSQNPEPFRNTKGALSKPITNVHLTSSNQPIRLAPYTLSCSDWFTFDRMVF